MVALPKIVNGSVSNLLSGVPALYTAPVLHSRALAKAGEAQGARLHLSAAADVSWKHLEGALLNVSSVLRGRDSSLLPRFQQRTVSLSGDYGRTFIATVGPVESQSDAEELCDHMGGSVCSHTDLVSQFASQAGICHECGWTRSVVKGQTVFLMESMASTSGCPGASSLQSGLVMCPYTDREALVHCCIPEAA